MDKNKILETIRLARKYSKKRNFNQSFDLIVNLVTLNLKKPEENIDFHVILPHSRTKKIKICAFVGNELEDKAKIFDKVIKSDEIQIYKNDKKSIKKLANDYDLFIAQANLMGNIASVFGRALGSKGKMPNPKYGCVVVPTSDLNKLKKDLNNMVKIRTNKELIIKCSVGSEDMKDEDISENILAVYSTLIHKLPQEEKNVKNVTLKLTMGPAIQLGVGEDDIKKNMTEKIKEPKKKKPKENEKEK